MNSGASASPWHPLTFGGVAAYAGASLVRLVLTQATVAATTSGILVWFVVTAWFPVVDSALRELPSEAGVLDRRLIWNGPSPTLLGQTPFLALGVNAGGTLSPGGTADLEIVFTPKAVRLSSLLGYWSLPYLAGGDWRVDPQRAAAWWDAWRRAIIAGMLAGSLLVQLGVGWFLAGVGSAPVRWMARGLNRSLPPRGGWKLAVAALLAPTLVAGASVVLYGLGRLDVVGLALGLVLHGAMGIVYLVGATLALPRGGRRGNPFRPGAAPARRRSRSNPFGRS